MPTNINLFVKEGWMWAGKPLDCQFEEETYKYQFQLLTNIISNFCQISIPTFVKYQFGQMPTVDPSRPTSSFEQKPINIELNKYQLVKMPTNAHLIKCQQIPILNKCQQNQFDQIPTKTNLIKYQHEPNWTKTNKYQQTSRVDSRLVNSAPPF